MTKITVILCKLPNGTNCKSKLFFLFDADLFSNICYFGKRYWWCHENLTFCQKVFFELDLFLENEFYMNPI